MALSKFQTRTMLFLAVVSSGFGLSAHAQRKPYSVKRAAGFVPDAKTAIRIAVAVWEPIYGEKQIASERPFKASLNCGIWLVQGTLPKGWNGGVAHIQIRKRDGCVLSVMHTQ